MHFPAILLKFAISLDGYLDDTSQKRLLLSNQADFDRVDAERADCDAILVGANALRKDNPTLVIKKQANRLKRFAAQKPPLTKVTLTASGNLSPDARFFTEGEAQKIIYCGNEAFPRLQERFKAPHIIVPSNEKGVDFEFLLTDLYHRGIRKLMVEGGGQVLTKFLQLGLFDELQISIAPFFVGEHDAPRFVHAGVFQHTKDHRLYLKSSEKIGDMALLTYLKT